MNDLAASIGIVQLKKLRIMNKKRSLIIKTYLKFLKDLKNIESLIPYEFDKYSYWIFGIRTEKRNDLIIKLKSHGIATGCHYTPLSKQPLFKKWGNSCPFIEKEIDKCITLPLHPDLTIKNIEFISSKIKKFSEKFN
jgi:perosamine synthetase